MPQGDWVVAFNALTKEHVSFNCEHRGLGTKPLIPGPLEDIQTIIQTITTGDEGQMKEVQANVQWIFCETMFLWSSNSRQAWVWASMRVAYQMISHDLDLGRGRNGIGKRRYTRQTRREGWGEKKGTRGRSVVELNGTIWVSFLVNSRVDSWHMTIGILPVTGPVLKCGWN